MSTMEVRMQRAVAQHLVDAGKMTRQQWESLPPVDSSASIIPDLWRQCKDDEAVAKAVAIHLNRKLFVELEDGVDVHLGSEHWLIYGSTSFFTNPLDHSHQEMAKAWSRANNVPTNRIGVISLSKMEQVRALKLESTVSESNSAEAVKQQASGRIDNLIREAAGLDSSDIHLVPTQGNEVSVRMRIDGELITRGKYSLSDHEAMSRVLMERCNQTLDMNDTQDGKFDFHVSQHKKINLRVSSIPVVRGSDKGLRFVLRLLGNNASLGSLDRLGISDLNKAILRRFGRLPNGLIVLTGPTGSGKTTTLNAMLQDIYGRDPNRNYHTIEDPVEIQHEGMSHTEVSQTLSFANALRAMLRQDPDVLLVGEIRDEETAEIAYKVAMTGHLVLSTLHTNSSHESIGRLERMHVPVDIVMANTVGFIAQRLVRALCPSCKDEYLLKSDPNRFQTYGRDPIFNGGGEIKVYRANPNGCAACNADGRKSGGLKGRRGIIEILEITPEVQEAILAGEAPGVLRRSQLAKGTFEDLWVDGLRLVKEGVIGFEQLEAELRPYLAERTAAAKGFVASVANNAVPFNKTTPQL